MKKQNKTKRKYLKLRIPQINKREKNLFTIVMLSLGIILLLSIFTNFFIPAILYLVDNAVYLIKLISSSQDVYISFFGRIFLLFIGYKIISTLLYFWAKAMEVVLKEGFSYANKIKMDWNKK